MQRRSLSSRYWFFELRTLPCWHRTIESRRQCEFKLRSVCAGAVPGGHGFRELRGLPRRGLGVGRRRHGLRLVPLGALLAVERRERLRPVRGRAVLCGGGGGILHGVRSGLLPGVARAIGLPRMFAGAVLSERWVHRVRAVPRRVHPGQQRGPRLLGLRRGLLPIEFVVLALPLRTIFKRRRRLLLPLRRGLLRAVTSIEVVFELPGRSIRDELWCDIVHVVCRRAIRERHGDDLLH